MMRTKKKSRPATMNKSALILLLALGFATSCTKKKEESIVAPPVTSPAPAPGNDVSAAAPTSLPKVDGIDVTGEKFEPEGPYFLVEELKVAEPGGKAIDQFPLLDWGPVKVLVENKTVRVFPSGDIFEIDYKVGTEQKIERTAKCKFTVSSGDQTREYADWMKRSAGAIPSWEAAYNSELMALASNGNKEAYEFFMSPSREQKKFKAAHGPKVSLEPSIRVLKYMKENSCKW